MDGDHLDKKPTENYAKWRRRQGLAPCPAEPIAEEVLAAGEGAAAESVARRAGANARLRTHMTGI